MNAYMVSRLARDAWASEASGKRKRGPSASCLVQAPQGRSLNVAASLSLQRRPLISS